MSTKFYQNFGEISNPQNLTKLTIRRYDYHSSLHQEDTMAVATVTEEKGQKLELGVLNNPTVAELAQYSVHKASCNKEAYFLMSRTFHPENQCSCGLSDLLKKLDLPDNGERSVFNIPHI